MNKMLDTGTKKAVLIVDDDPDIREVIRTQLEAHELPMKFAEAANGSEAVRKIQLQRFDLVITDLDMPKMNGKDLLSSLRTTSKKLRPKRIIVCSGNVEKDILKETPGGVSILKKPFKAEDLARYISVVLSDSRRKNESTAAPKEGLNVEFINPFINATLEVLNVMAGVKSEKDFVFVKEDDVSLGDITGIIPITSDDYMGSMAISFTEDVYLKVISSMLDEECLEIDENNKDGVAEICNQIFGNAKSHLSRIGFKLGMTIPTVVVGPRHHISHAVKGGSVLGVYFKTEYGTFIIECVVVKKS